MGCRAGTRSQGGGKAMSRWGACPPEGLRWAGPDPVQPPRGGIGFAECKNRKPLEAGKESSVCVHMWECVHVCECAPKCECVPVCKCVHVCECECVHTCALSGCSQVYAFCECTHYIPELWVPRICAKETASSTGVCGREGSLRPPWYLCICVCVRVYEYAEVMIPFTQCYSHAREIPYVAFLIQSPKIFLKLSSLLHLTNRETETQTHKGASSRLQRQSAGGQVDLGCWQSLAFSRCPPA